MSDKDFETWWEREGSKKFGAGMQVFVSDRDEYLKDIALIAWSNGRYKMSPQQKIKAAVSVCGVEAVFDSLCKMLKDGAREDLIDDLVVQDNGSIYDERMGCYLTDQELSEFLEWAEGEKR